MTAISSLQSIHKKGIFGDHHKQNQKDFTQISEIKNLNIINIVKYKKSRVELENIDIDWLKISKENSKVSSNTKTRILWIGPDSWLVISKNENILGILNKSWGDKNFAITDISHSRSIIQIKGACSKEILKKGCPLNFYNFDKDNCAGSVFHGINIVVDLIDNNPDTFNILTLRSFGESFYHHVTDAALEFGYIGV